MRRQAWSNIIVQLQKIDSKCLFAYDGGKIAYSTYDLPETTLNINVEKILDVDLPASGPARQASRGGRGRGGRGRGGGRESDRPTRAPSVFQTATSNPTDVVKREEKVKVVIRRVAGVILHDLLKLAQGKDPETESTLHGSNALSVALRHVPAMLYVPVGANIFMPHGRVSISGGLEIWQGFHQSVRVMMAGHLGVNVDVAATCFRQGGMSVLDYACDMLDARDVQDLSRMSNLKRRLLSVLNGVSVVTMHSNTIKQRFRLNALSNESADSHFFEDKEGNRLNVTQYFEKAYGIRLKYPFLPLALKGNKKTAFPLETLKIIPAQRYMNRLNGDQTADMIRVTCERPGDRKQRILTAARESLAYTNNPLLESFGLKVETEFMKVPARILPAPDLVFAQNSTLRGADGAWNLRDQRLINGKRLESAAWIFFVRIDSRDARHIRDKMFQFWSRTGMQINCQDCPIIIQNPSEPGGVQRALKDAMGEARRMFNKRIQMAICVLDKDPKHLYSDIKRLALCEAELITQCLQFRNVRQDIKAQYASNLCLKANIKLGGATNHVSHIPVSDRPFMFFGADVTHASPGSASPSIAAVTASIDRHAVEYHTYLRAQGHRVEIIQDLKNIAIEAIKNFSITHSGVFPERIIFFRDGVSAGQFKEVVEKEVSALKEAFAVLGRKIDLTFLVINKRHHVRLFPGREQDRSGNCMPGTIIDTTIMQPHQNNFLLMSHSGLQGTSRPTIYHVLYDEIGIPVDDLQQLCFNLCFLPERATRAVAVVAPTYRANIASQYSRIFLHGEQDSAESVISGDTQDVQVTFKNITESMQRTMYYM
ncbi:Piwi domain-containing protein [Gorgonomyces haynaldii]|nr:Piwi domain-containing protein [Gorgonomyces haynaldii]